MKVDNNSQLLELQIMSQLFKNSGVSSSSFSAIMENVIKSMQESSSNSSDASNNSALSDLTNALQSGGGLGGLFSDGSDSTSSLGSLGEDSDDNSLFPDFGKNTLGVGDIYSNLNGVSISDLDSPQKYAINQKLINSTTAKTKTSGNISIDQAVDEASKKYNVDRNLINAVIEQESSFNPNSVSSAGAVGLMQLMPSTASELGVSDPFNVEQNVDGGTKYLRELLDMYGNSKELALAAYNAGPQAVARYNGIPQYAETQDYVKKVMQNYAKNSV
ncbi:MAG: lytic transglycosylase domain-containing protein [Bacillota bacterium]|nr:lytic transglycosylase domain-containing protein [Bacillota bacterium]